MSEILEQDPSLYETKEDLFEKLERKRWLEIRIMHIIVVFSLIYLVLSKLSRYGYL